jgi:hypothetical protein
MKKIIAIFISILFVLPFVYTPKVQAFTNSHWFEVEVTPSNAGVNAAYHIYNGVSDFDGINILEIYLQWTSFTFVHPDPKTVTVNGMPAISVTMQAVPDRSTSRENLKITVVLSKRINSGDTIDIKISKSAGIINPVDPRPCYSVAVYLLSGNVQKGYIGSDQYAITQSAVTNVNVKINPAIKGMEAEYDVSFFTGVNGNLKKGDDIRIKFPEGTVLPANPYPQYVLINGKQATGVYRDSTNPPVLRIYIPQDIENSSPVGVIIKKNFGLYNTDQSGTYKLYVSTYKEPDWMESNEVKIAAPQVQNLSVKLGSDVALENTSIKLTFLTSPVGFLKAGDKIYINFYGVFSLPSSINSKDILFNGNKTSASISGSTLAITVPSVVQPNGLINIDIPEEMGIINPSKPGDYKISVNTTSDETPTFFTVKVTASSLSNVEFKADHSGVSVSSGFEISFNTGSLGTLKAGVGKIFIDFDKGFVLPASLPEGAVTVNGISANSSVNSSELIIVVPQDISANSAIKVNIAESAGIKNPDKEGKYGVTVYTSSEETPVQSNKVSIIPLPSIQFVVQPASPDGDNGYYITTPTVQIVSSKEGAVYYKIDDGDYSLYSAPVQIPDGDHTLYAYATDEEGNKGDVVSKEFKVDTKLPQVTFDQGSGNIYVNSIHPTLTGKMSEPCSVIQVNGVDAKIDNENLTFMVSLNVSDKGSLAVIAKALSGMTSSFVLTVYVDTTPPEVKVISPNSEPFTTTDDAFDIKFTINENCRSVEVNNTPVQKGGDGTYEYNANLIEGNNVFYITATDLAGNVTSVPVSIQKVNSIIVKLTIGDKTAYVGNNSVTLDSPPIIKNSRTLVPLRFISQAFGAKVQWDGAIKVITIIHNFHMIQLQINSKIVTVDGAIEKIDSPPIIKNNRTLVPLRFISQAFGAKVQWDGKTKTITLIYTP